MKRYIIKFWLPLVIASTIIVLAIYASFQQSMRLSANDPQIQLAEDGAAALSNGMMPAVLIGNSRVDIQKSLAPFVIIFDNNGKVQASSGFLNGEVPVLPSGVFEYTRSNTDDRITWQPASSTRVAAVIKHFEGKNSGFIAVGRNIRELEDRLSQIQFMLASAWAGLLVLTFISILYVWAVEKKEADDEFLRELTGKRGKF